MGGTYRVVYDDSVPVSEWSMSSVGSLVYSLNFNIGKST